MTTNDNHNAMNATTKQAILQMANNLYLEGNLYRQVWLTLDYGSVPQMAMAMATGGKYVTVFNKGVLVREGQPMMEIWLTLVDLQSYSIPRLKEMLNDEYWDEHIESILAQEKAGKNRKGAVTYLEKRLQSVPKQMEPEAEAEAQPKEDRAKNLLRKLKEQQVSGRPDSEGETLTTTNHVEEEEMETTNQTNREESKMNKELEKIARHEKAEKARAKNWLQGEILEWGPRGDEAGYRMRTGTMLQGMLVHLALHGMGPKIEGPSVVQVLNEHKDRSGRKIPIPMNKVIDGVKSSMPEACRLFSIKESHLVNVGWLPWMADVFETAATARSYASGLCAPGHFFREVEVLFVEDLMTPEQEVVDYCLRPTGQLVPMVADGNGIVHPAHPILAALGIGEDGAAIQGRTLELDIKMFGKGIFVVSELAEDDDGNPVIKMNRSFVKGNMKKKEIPDRMKVAIQIINIWDRPHARDNSVCSFEHLQLFASNEVTREGVRQEIERNVAILRKKGGMAKFAKDAAKREPMIEAAVELAESRDINPMDIKMVYDVASVLAGKWGYTLWQGAGIQGPTFTMVQDAGIPAMVKDKQGVMRPAYAISPEVERELYLFTIPELDEEYLTKRGRVAWEDFISNTRDEEGAHPGSANLNGRVTKMGIKAWQRKLAKLNAEMDIPKHKDGVPKLKPGTTLWIERIDDVYLPGDLIAVARYPLVTQQNFVFGVVVAPGANVLKATKRLAARTLRSHPRNITLLQTGDSDGDRTVVFGAERLVGEGGWMRPEHKLGNVHDDSLVGDFGSVAYYLEPEKADAESDPIQKIKIVSDEGKISLAGLKLMATESGGPVGQTTYLHAMFMTLMDICLQMGMKDDALHMARCALAMSILVQESVDNQKRATPYTDPTFAVKAENWIEVGPGEYALPKKHPARHMPDSWYKNYEIKELDVARIRNWAYDQVESVEQFSYLAELRNSKGGRTWGSRNITNWRLDSKTLNMVEAELSESYIIHDDEEMVNLVGYCARVACGEIKSLVRDSGSEEKLDLVEIILNDILKAKPELDFQPRPEKEAKALKQVVGLTDYNKAMRKMMNLDPEHREAERTAAYHDFSVALSKASAQQVLYVILDIIESTEQDDAGRLNNVIKLVCTEGSRLKEAVGLGSVETCTYMSEIRQERKLKDGTVKISRAQMTAEWLLKKQEEFRETGGYVSLPALALSATGRTSLHPALEGLGTDQGKPSGHLATHGVEIHKCRACCDAVDKAVRGLMAPERESHRTALKRFITAVNHSDKIKKINTALAAIPNALRYTAGKTVVAEKDRWLLAMLGYKK